MGNGRRSRHVHRLRCVRDGVPRREQHPDRRSRAGGARARHALAARRALLGRRLSRRAPEVPARHVPAVRRRAVRAGVPDLREPSHRRGAERAGLQPLHRHALLRQRVPVQRPLLRAFQPAVAQAAPPPAESGRLGPRGRRHGEVPVLRAAQQPRVDLRESREARAEGRRHQAGLRAGVLGQGDGVRRPERSRKRGLAAVAVAARRQAARRSRHASQSHVSRTPDAGMSEASSRKLSDDLLRPLLQTSWRFYVLVAFLGSIVLMGLGTWAYQMFNGFGVTGINNPIFWAFYITNFVFWIGISHAGTLISAILRLVNAGWRRPVTRCAEVITAFALMIGAMFPIIHLGRPWLFFWLMPYPSSRLIWPNFRSPLVWDFFAITTYLTGSVLFLVLPMIPDFALVRDRTTGLRSRVYGMLALGWQGTPKQWHRLESAMSIMAIAIIPVAVSVHTIVSFDFSMAPVPMWHSTMFGPYFVAGAIFSGIAGLIIAMAALRKFLHIEEYLHPVHFQNLGKLLLMMSLLWGYFVFAERLTVWYGNESAEIQVLRATQKGSFAPLYWTMVVVNFVIPVTILSIRKLRTITGCVIASCGVLVGMWLERFLIVVPSLGHKYLPYSWGTYRPRPVEILITISTFAAMTLLYTLFAKFVPIISIWELKVGEQEPRETALERSERVLGEAKP